jgi:adenylate cyclase
MQIEFVGERMITVNKDQTILDASLQSGIPHFHACGGKGKCTTCRIMILEGEENLSRPNKKEAKLRESIQMTSSIRLACQTKVLQEPVVVERIIKDISEIPQYIQLNEKDLKAKKLKPLGEERYLVLFFLDIRNFTPFIETYLPFDVMYITRKLFDVFYKIIIKHKGKLIETAGDELYVVFGLETSIRDAADDSISAGLEIIDELDKLNRSYLNVYFFKEFDVGIGIHSGKVIIGELNLEGRLKTTVMGLAVNIASRIQNATKDLNNSLVASEEVVRHSSFKVKHQSSHINLKGVTSNYNVYLLGREYKKPNQKDESDQKI